jgi:hypothetical protein
LGYEKLETDEVPAGYVSTKKEDPYPIILFGKDKPISDSKIINYLNDTFYYYLNIYENTKKFGLPYKNWLDCPGWLLQLIKLFDDITKKYERMKG